MPVERIRAEVVIILKMQTQKNQTWLPVVLIAGALIGWMAILAAGAYWAPVGEGPERAAEAGDPRKLWVVAATTGGFLLLWGMVLLLRQRTVRREREDSGDPPAR